MFLWSIVQPCRAVLWLAVLLAGRFHYQVETSTHSLQVGLGGRSKVFMCPNECSVGFAVAINQHLAKSEPYSTHNRKDVGLIRNRGPFLHAGVCMLFT